MMEKVRVIICFTSQKKTKEKSKNCEKVKF